MQSPALALSRCIVKEFLADLQAAEYMVSKMFRIMPALCTTSHFEKLEDAARRVSLRGGCTRLFVSMVFQTLSNPSSARPC